MLKATPEVPAVLSGAPPWTWSVFAKWLLQPVQWYPAAAATRQPRPPDQARGERTMSKITTLETEAQSVAEAILADLV
jgi:hypothetical protein